jgi:16S rRNA processing protein RimM
VASDELVPVGRVGKPHGLDGSFFVEGASEREDVFAAGATVFLGGDEAKVVASRHGAGGRPVIRLDRRVERGSELAVPRATLPQLDDEDEFYVFQLVGLSVERAEARTGSGGTRVPWERRARARLRRVASPRRGVRPSG